ncbi:MAG: hypothetical protein QXO70_01675 [Candidatus Pacearchaeota archaeon]
MTKKFLEKVVEGVVGKSGKELVNILERKKDINEFIIAKKLNMTINQVRNLLYKLSDIGLISSSRKKDRRKGWYTYYWTLNIKNCLEYLKNTLYTNIEHLKDTLRSKESKRFYVCKYCGVEVTEENALLHNFTCNECGEIYELADNSKQIKDMKNSIEKIQNEIEEINLALNKIYETESKKLMKEKHKRKKEKNKRIKKIKKRRVIQK